MRLAIGKLGEVGRGKSKDKSAHRRMEQGPGKGRAPDGALVERGIKRGLKKSLDFLGRGGAAERAEVSAFFSGDGA